MHNGLLQNRWQTLQFTAVSSQRPPSKHAVLTYQRSALGHHGIGFDVDVEVDVEDEAV